jgi:galactose mutarotase-like enzyme
MKEKENILELKLDLSGAVAGGNAKVQILPAAGGAIASFSVGDIPVLKPVKIPLTEGAWPAGGMPFCFPFAGRVWHEGKVGKYQPAGVANGNASFEMPIHGFNAAAKWNIVEQNATNATLETADTEATSAIFPWKFSNRLEYRLSASDKEIVALSIKATIRCDSLLPEAEGRNMPVSPGFHPYFSARHPGEKHDGFFSFAYDDAVIPALETVQVTAEGNAGARKLALDLFGESAKSTKQGISIPLHQEALHNLIFSGLSGREVRLGKIALSWSKESPWRKLVCWAKPADHFFCLEPWYGLPDAVHRPRGTLEIAPGNSIQFDFRITINT